MNKNIKKQPFEKEIDGRRMRYCMKYNIWVNREGTYVYREYKDPAWNHALQIHTRPDGSKYLDTKSHGEIPLDEAVAICFSPMPRDGRKYVPVHKDNNPGNCHASILHGNSPEVFSDRQGKKAGITDWWYGRWYHT